MSIGPWDRESGMSTLPPPVKPSVVPKPPIRGIDRMPEEVIKPPVKPDPPWMS